MCDVYVEVEIREPSAVLERELDAERLCEIVRGTLSDD